MQARPPKRQKAEPPIASDAGEATEKARSFDPSQLDPSKTAFLSNLAFTTEEAQVEEALSQGMPAGYSIKVHLVRDGSKRCKGFGYACIAPSLSLEPPTDGGDDKALASLLDLDRTVVAGRPIFISPHQPVPKAMRQSVAYQKGYNEKVLFVSRLPPDTDKESLAKLFAENAPSDAEGPISTRMIYTKEGCGLFKGVAYVEFASKEGAAQGLLLDKASYKGSRGIRVQISDAIGSKCEGQGLRMMPRSVQMPARDRAAPGPQEAQEAAASNHHEGTASMDSNEDFRRKFLGI